MKWQTKIIGAILLVALVVGFYYAMKEQELTIQNFPSGTFYTPDVDQPIMFGFALVNDNNKNVDVEPISALLYGADGLILSGPVIVDPSTNFTMEAGETKEITVEIVAPQRRTEGTILVEITYGNGKKISIVAPMQWGGLPP